MSHSDNPRGGLVKSPPLGFLPTIRCVSEGISYSEIESVCEFIAFVDVDAIVLVIEPCLCYLFVFESLSVEAECDVETVVIAFSCPYVDADLRIDKQAAFVRKITSY